jgi:hypothetical protein
MIERRPYATNPRSQTPKVGRLAASLVVLLGVLLSISGCPNPVAGDKNPPVISKVAAVAKDAKVKVSWTTNEESTSKVEYGRTSSYDFVKVSDEFVTEHLIILTDLVAGVQYHYRVSSTDRGRNETFSVDTTFTATDADTVPPRIFNIFSTNNSEKREITFTWETDEETTGRIEYGPAADYGSLLEDIDPSTGQPKIALKHSATLPLSEIDFGVLQYHYGVRAADEAGNSATSDDLLTSPLNVRIDAGSTGRQHLPKLAASGGVVHIAWADERSGESQIYLASSRDGGKIFTVNAFGRPPLQPYKGKYQDIAAEGENVYLVWQGNETGSGAAIYFSRSTDGGTTFEDAVKVDGGSSYPQVHPSVAAAGGRVFIAWQDLRNDEGDIYLATSSDGGITLGPSVLAHSQSAGLQTRPAITSDGSKVYVAWQSIEGRRNHIYTARSDNGLDWSDPVRVDDGSSGGGGHPTMKSSSGGVYLAWHDNRSGFFDVFSASSTTGGTSWGANRRINEIAAAHGGAYPAMAVDSQGYIHLAWQDSRNPIVHIYLSVSTDNGLSWGRNVLIDDSAAGNKYRPSLAVSGAGEVYVAWQDERRGIEKTDIFFTKYKYR